MRFLLFTLFWAFTFAPSLQAQTLGQDYPILVEWETFVEDQQNKEVPNEQARLLKKQLALIAEKEAHQSEREIIQHLRTSYWNNFFYQANQIEISKAIQAQIVETNASKKAAPVVLDNPNLVATNCAIEIAIIIDQSGSLNQDQEDNIRNGLLAFIANQNISNTGNTVTFIGTGRRNNTEVLVPANVSETVTYDPGTVTSHSDWIQNDLYFSGNTDSWSVALVAAADISADLVILVTSSNTGHGSGEDVRNTDAANVLKAAGTHLFVFADEDANYNSDPLFAEMQEVIDPNPMQAVDPITMEQLSTLDYFPVSDNFADLTDWLSVIDGTIGTAEITNIQYVKGHCLEGEICFSGRYNLCKGVTLGTTAPQLIFSQNGVEVASPIMVLNSDGTYFKCFTKQQLVDMGLDLNTGYDAFMSITTTEGVITSPPYIDGFNNDFSIIPGPGYVDLNFVGVIPGACFDNEVCFSGVYDLCEGNSESTPTTISFEQNGVEVASVTLTLNPDGTFYSCYTESQLIAAGLESGSSYDAFVIINSTSGTTLTSPLYTPGINNDFTINYIGIGETFITDIDQQDNLCLEAETCFSGTYEICPNVSVNSAILVFGQNGNSMAYAPITLDTDGTFSECFTNQELLELGLGLDSGESYDAFVQITTDGGNITSPPFIAGNNNDFFFEAYDADILPISVPECVEEGVPFQVIVHFDNIITDADIENIYSYNNLYTYVSHTIYYPQGGTNVVITFESNTCSCAGEILTFDISMVGCSTPIWLMTHDPIPCCVTECTSVRVTDWEAGDCFYYNGDIARPFTIDVTSSSPIIDIMATLNIATCQTTIEDLEVTYVSGNNYVISGVMVFQDPDCVGTAWLSLLVETKNTCCSIDQQFSFPKGCTLKPCNIGAVEAQMIAHSGLPVMAVSLNLPIGTVVQVTDNINGGMTNATVQNITCGPFLLNPDGTIGGGTPCNGILIEAPFSFDCRKAGNKDTSYNYTISGKKCDWVIAGDYCEVPTIYPGVPGFSQGEANPFDLSKERSNVPTTAKRNELANQIQFYPNPIQSSAVLNFDFSGNEVAVHSIRITDLSGRVMETIIPTNESATFSHPLSNDFSEGVYFVIFGMEDGRLESKKLVVLK